MLCRRLKSVILGVLDWDQQITPGSCHRKSYKDMEIHVGIWFWANRGHAFKSHLMSYTGADHDNHMYTNKPLTETHSQALDFICPETKQLDWGLSKLLFPKLFLGIVQDLSHIWGHKQVAYSYSLHKHGLLYSSWDFQSESEPRIILGQMLMILMPNCDNAMTTRVYWTL